MTADKSDLVLRNGSIYTVDGKGGWAQALAVSNGRITFVGSNADAVAYIHPETTVIDLDGMMVLPAFVDSHMHPAYSAHLYQYQLNLSDVTAKDQFGAYLDEIRDFANRNPDASWIIGSGYSRQTN